MFKLSALRQHVTSAHAIAVVALVVASGGTAYAAATIGSAQIIDNSVRSVDLRNEHVRGIDVRNGSLGTQELSDTARESLRTKFRATGTLKTAAGGAHVTEKFLCDYEGGELASGGGGYSYFAGKGMLTKSTPVYGGVGTPYEGLPIGWEVSMQNLSGDTNHLVVRVICAKD